MNATPDIMTTGLKMVAALGMVLALILFMLYGLRKITGRRLGGGRGKHIQVLESHYMGVKKSIAMVHVPGKVLVLGITTDRITLLDTIDDDRIETPPEKQETQAFGPLLSERLKKIGLKRKGRDAS